MTARALHPDSSLGDMYSYMHPELVKAHRALDKAVDAAYGYKGGKDDAARVKQLFELHQKITAPLMPALAPVKKSRTVKVKSTRLPL